MHDLREWCLVAQGKGVSIARIAREAEASEAQVGELVADGGCGGDAHLLGRLDRRSGAGRAALLGPTAR
jgi:hypothetical protein